MLSFSRISISNLSIHISVCSILHLPKVELIEISLKIQGRVDLFTVSSEICQPDCMTELAIQLGTIFITNIIIGQSKELIIP
jgi:hypothetical protein